MSGRTTTLAPMAGRQAPRPAASPRRDAPASVAPGVARARATEADRRAFLEASISGGRGAATSVARRIGALEPDAAAVLEDLAASSARALGARWLDDETTFVDVSLALCRVHEAVREAGAGRRAPPAGGGPRGRILIGQTIGDQHMLGPALVANAFRAAGWTADVEPGATTEGLAAAAGALFYGVIGLSATVDRPIDEMRTAIETIRRASRNPAARLIVGGPFFDADPARASAVGADAYAPDAASAVDAAATLLAAGGERC